MLEVSEVGNKVGKEEYEAAIPQLRVGLINAQYDLRGADFPVIIWIAGDDRLAAINPVTGQVRCFVDLEPILSREERRRYNSEEVLNGMAYDVKSDRFFVTGKCWDKLYEIEVLDPDGRGPGGGGSSSA